MPPRFACKRGIVLQCTKAIDCLRVDRDWLPGEMLTKASNLKLIHKENFNNLKFSIT